MATINQLRTERFAYFRELKRGLRDVDSGVEEMQRLIERVLNRKRDVPDLDDFEKLVQGLRTLLQVMSLLEALVTQGEPIFSVF